MVSQSPSVQSLARIEISQSCDITLTPRDESNMMSSKTVRNNLAEMTVRKNGHLE